MAENNLHQKSSNVTAIGQASIKRPTRKVKAMAVIAAPVLVLTKDESIILQAFRTMSDQCRRQFAITMPMAAARARPPRATPALRLIVGGAA